MRLAIASLFRFCIAQPLRKLLEQLPSAAEDSVAVRSVKVRDEEIGSAPADQRVADTVVLDSRSCFQFDAVQAATASRTASLTQDSSVQA